MANRRQPALATTPQPKLAITLEDWEAKAPLGEIETRSINLVKEASERATLPVKVRTFVYSGTLKAPAVRYQA